MYSRGVTTPPLLYYKCSDSEVFDYFRHDLVRNMFIDVTVTSGLQNEQ